MTGSNYESRELSSENQPELVHHEQESPADSPRPPEGAQPSGVSPSKAPAAQQQSAINSHTIPQLRSRLIRCFKSRTNEPDWQLLLQQTESFADIEIHYGYYWRDGFGGVLPAGYDASSVAGEAVAELFNEQPQNGLILVPRMLRVELRKRARKIINRLHHRMENRIIRSEPDLLPFLTDDGETIRAVEKVPGPHPTPLDILLEKEDAARFEQFKTEIRALLAQDKPLLRLFGCFCAGICKPKEQARKLKVPVRHIQDLQRRLRRKLAAHGYVPSSWRSRMRANYLKSQHTCYQMLAKAA